MESSHNKYENWKVPEIKNELRKRNARLSGRKKELLERYNLFLRLILEFDSYLHESFCPWNESESKQKNVYQRIYSFLRAVEIYLYLFFKFRNKL